MKKTNFTIGNQKQGSTLKSEAKQQYVEQTTSNASKKETKVTNADLKAKIVALERDKKNLSRKLGVTFYCQKYITTGCFDAECPFSHVEKDVVDKEEEE